MTFFRSLTAFLLLLVSSLAAASDVPLYLSLEQRTILSYALEAAHRPRAEQTRLLERALERVRQAVSKPSQIHKVKSFEQFIAIWKGSWPDTHSLSLDLEILEKTEARALPRFEGASDSLDRKIADYQRLQRDWLKETTGSGRLLGLFGDGASVGEVALEAALGDKAQRTELFFRETDRLFAGLVGELDGVGERIARSPKLDNKDVAVRRLLVALFSGYFAGLELPAKKQIMSAVLGGDLRADEMRFFETMIQNSGPQMQKILQIVGRQNDLDPSMLEIFRRLESGVRAVPPVLVKRLLENENKNYRFANFEDKPIGVGTMAQVHRAALVQDGTTIPVVVRFLKPDIDLRVDQDHRILTAVAAKLDQDPEFRASGAPRLSPLIEDITRTVRAELDLFETIERQRTATTSYQGLSKFKNADGKWEIEFSVPKVWSGPKASRLMVQGLIKGTKLEAYLEDQKTDRTILKREIVEAVARLWTNELFFGQGFFHADLHPGNFMVEDLGDRKLRLHLLDYGMAGQLGESQRRGLIALGAGLQLGRADVIAKAFFELSDRQRHAFSLSDVEKLVRARMASLKGRPLSEQSLERWSADLMDAGLVMPYEFVNVNRGLVIINKMLEDAGSKKSVSLISEDIAGRRPWLLSKILRESGMGFSDLARLGWKQWFPGEPISAIPARPPGAAAVGVRCGEVFK